MEMGNKHRSNTHFWYPKKLELDCIVRTSDVSVTSPSDVAASALADGQVAPQAAIFRREAPSHICVDPVHTRLKADGTCRLVPASFLSHVLMQRIENAAPS
jgi:hypothetical protein